MLRLCVELHPKPNLWTPTRLNDDVDGLLDGNDACPLGATGVGDDMDSDGCKNTEDADDDNDGLLDTWEIQYFGNLTQASADNPDGDELSNLQEFSGSTNLINYDMPAWFTSAIFAIILF